MLAVGLAHRVYMQKLLVVCCQICEEVLQMLRSPDVFGKCDDITIETYMSQCHNLFPLHRAFVRAPPTTNSGPANSPQTSDTSSKALDCNHDGTNTAPLPNGDATP